MPKYIIDANILIQAYRKYYPMDVFCGFWDRMKLLANSSHIISIDKVKDEVWPNGDALMQWCDNQLPNDFFVTTTMYISEYAHIIKTVTNMNKYTSNAIAEFADNAVADAFLIATAYSAVDDYVLVSEEIANPNSHKRVKIPDICNLFGVRCINTVDMLRELNVTI
jgi:hypothetical protein